LMAFSGASIATQGSIAGSLRTGHRWRSPVLRRATVVCRQDTTLQGAGSTDGPALSSVHTEKATAPHGHYAQAVVTGDTVYVSGLLGNSLREHIDVRRDMATQVAHCMDQLEAILDEADSAPDLIVKLSVFVSDVDDWTSADEVLGKRFGRHRPARIVVPTGAPLRYGSRIEIDAIALKRSYFDRSRS